MDEEMEILAETENFTVWRAEDPEGETNYHVELGNVTLHFFEEEWKELRDLFKAVAG